MSHSLDSTPSNAAGKVEGAENVADASKPVAWMRRWAFEKVTPAKVKNEKGRWVWPLKYKFVEVTKAKIFADDVALFANYEPPTL